MPPRKRNTPCRACKKRQKGCFWRSSSNVCIRCEKWNVDCIVVSQQDDLEPAEDDDTMPKEFVESSLEYWRNQVRQLETELSQAEATVKQCRSSNNSYSNRSSPISHSSYNEFSSLSNCSSPCSITSQISDNHCEEPAEEHQGWKLVGRNGQVKLQTTINTLEELFMYSRASLRYLSPFDSLFEDSFSVRFENRYFISATFRAFRFMFSQAAQPRLLLQENEKQELQEAPLPMETIRGLMDRLVHLYLKHENIKHGFLYQPMYLQHYESLKDPLSCPVTLALCVSFISSTRKLDEEYSSAERQRLAQFFFGRCKGILGDMFDDPNRKFETVMTINFLKHYIWFVLLQPMEARRLITIAYLLCKDLEHSYDGEGENNHVQRVLVQRHLLHNERMLNMFHFMDNGSAFKPILSVYHLEKLPDEGATTGLYIDMSNHLLKMAGDFVMKMVTGPERMSINSNSLSLESIIKCDLAIKEWWKSTPPHLRLCDNLYTDNIHLTTELDWIKGVIFCFAHVSIMRAHVCLVKPVYSDDRGDANFSNLSPEVLNSLREHAAEIVLRSCDLMLDVMIQMLSYPDDLPSIVIFELISRSMSALVTVSGNDASMTIYRKFYQCIDAIRALFPSDTLTVSSSSSPLNALVTSRQNSDGDFTVYQQYPLPGYALFADILNISCAHLRSHLVSTSRGSSYLAEFIESVNDITPPNASAN
ncbi:hypothetical protein BDB00DRAFT_803682 [Zychaea mexicana]|uniref:uncharacterized protein n=1 Tax=Zychaea mexicana TaxID=64656 RepID=UPI0022FDEB88|nr:uncharacterized protein BDB00DRAFT_803682 [Zychaea mexicana]KAI9497700.1 hypothetical protein BDB00DRAFT_803682 [Zychaea mexicana]